ncbi:GDSL-type esterase/lipase family protein [Sphingomonas sp. HITSZ_GF]|uniref:GDSL-type esterase/lipase family protein n=1 Tax=Sphingomonas sp. HITSZ_GF TaxID=3037247 RepID=UPI00240D48A9|nr:GDSL-type esterase/lipase family protein [Sphingomonas sp. HITSZ_GF]MDG2533794.1 GDSL-type esterase/lipase family protein [Sphingomonas sp. HITSZ_GF]
MSTPPVSQSPLRIALAALGKCMLALAIFSGIFGTYMWMRAREPLPGASQKQGACVLWFVGSSSMSRWASLQQDLSPWYAQNRGIAGATMSELNLHFAHDEAKRAPQAIVYYAGDNDLAFGRSVADTVADLRAFLEIKSKLFGKTPVFLISLKPSPTRWEQRVAQDQYNAAAKAIALARTDIAYVDIVPLLLENGRPGPFFKEDGLHLNDEGYRRWKVALRRTLDARFKPEVVERCNPDRS